MAHSAARAGKLALTLGGILLGLVLAELATRIAGGGRASMSRGMFFVFDRDAGTRCRPDADLRFIEPGSFDVRVRCNSEGLRDHDHVRPKPPGVRRILCLGDSFTWGYGVENAEMVSSRLEVELPRFETVNFGVAGYSAVQELARLESDGFSYEPDWTIVFFCDNDLAGSFEQGEADRPTVELRPDQALHITNRPVRASWSVPFTRWLHCHSRLVVEAYYCATLLREQAKERATARQAAAKTRPAPAKVDASRIVFSLLDRFVAPDARMEQAWRTLAQIYEAMRDDCARHGSRLLVVYVPDPLLSVASDYAKALADAQIASASADWERPERRFAEICAALRVPCVDPVPDFRRVPDPQRLFLPGNPHWSAAGHALAAQVVAGRLRELDR